MRFLCMLTALALLPVLATGQAAADASATETSAWAELDRALIDLDQAITQHNDYALWTDVRVTAGQARAELDAARRQGAPADLCLAVQRTIAALVRRQDELERQAFAETEAERAWDQALLDGLVDDLLFAEGRLPDTSFLLAETLFLLGRDDEAQQALARALVLWPDSTRLHETVRVWQDVLPRPADLVEQLTRRAASLGATRPGMAGLAFETIGQLQMTMGRAEYADARARGDEVQFGVAGLLFDAAARSLHQSRSMPARLSPDAVSKLRGDALVSAAYSQLGRAKVIWKTDRIERELAPQAMLLAEHALTDALRLDHENRAYQDAVLYVGQEWMDKGHAERTTSSDMDDARLFYGRMAATFDNADWWNNSGFLSREMGTATYDEAQARTLFEESYEAYQQAIALAPDNARYVNDTGLMLLHHLHVDLDLAEELFRRSWALGKEVCDNPFVEQDVYDENFSAYTDAMLNLAHLYHEQGQLARALEIASELVALDPERPDAAQRLRRIERDLAGTAGSEGTPSPAG